LIDEIFQTRQASNTDAAVIIAVPVLLAVSITGLKEKYKSLPVYGKQA
jgi:hypothetical protein